MGRTSVASHTLIAIDSLRTHVLIVALRALATDVNKAILSGHQSGAMVGGLWESRSPRAPPEVRELVLDLDPAYSGIALDAPNEADESQELTYVDIDNFLENY